MMGGPLQYDRVPQAALRMCCSIGVLTSSWPKQFLHRTDVTGQLLSGYSEKDLALLLDFMARAQELTKQQVLELRREREA